MSHDEFLLASVGFSSTSIAAVGTHGHSYRSCLLQLPGRCSACEELIWGAFSFSRGCSCLTCGLKVHRRCVSKSTVPMCPTYEAFIKYCIQNNIGKALDKPVPDVTHQDARGSSIEKITSESLSTVLSASKHSGLSDTRESLKSVGKRSVAVGVLGGVLGGPVGFLIGLKVGAVIGASELAVCSLWHRAEKRLSEWKALNLKNNQILPSNIPEKSVESSTENAEFSKIIQEAASKKFLDDGEFSWSSEFENAEIFNFVCAAMQNPAGKAHFLTESLVGAFTLKYSIEKCETWSNKEACQENFETISENELNAIREDEQMAENDRNPAFRKSLELSYSFVEDQKILTESPVQLQIERQISDREYSIIEALPSEELVDRKCSMEKDFSFVDKKIDAFLDSEDSTDRTDYETVSNLVIVDSAASKLTIDEVVEQLSTSLLSSDDFCGQKDEPFPSKPLSLSSPCATDDGLYKMKNPLLDICYILDAIEQSILTLNSTLFEMSTESDAILRTVSNAIDHEAPSILYEIAKRYSREISSEADAMLIQQIEDLSSHNVNVSEEAVDALSDMFQAITVLDKLSLVLAAVQGCALKLGSESTVDALLVEVSMTVLMTSRRSSMARYWHAEIVFIEGLVRRDNWLQGGEAYALTTLEAALHVLASPDMLSEAFAIKSAD